jgi:hypothetical protein
MIWGITKLIKPIVPIRETIILVTSVAMKKIIIRERLTGTPKAAALS